MTTGGAMQAEISHVYNSSEAGTNLGQGYGWRLSCVQRLDTTGIKEYPYVYTDEDGTKHYFYKDTNDGNKLKDEDGLGLVITVESGMTTAMREPWKQKTGYGTALEKTVI